MMSIPSPVERAVDQAVASGETVTVHRKDGRKFTGRLVYNDNGSLTVRTGSRGRPPSVPIHEIDLVFGAV